EAKTRQELEKFEDQRGLLARQAQAKLDYIESTTKSMRLDQDFSKLKIDTDRLELLLEKVENRFDNMAVGVYMREKITKAFQSDTFCKAAVACTSGGKPNNGIGAGDLEDVFGGSPDNARRTPRPNGGSSAKAK